ncbi:MAG: SMC-Scp complex subunit ScpB [Pseudomonadota bacterium]
MKKLKSILESLLFLSEKPLPLPRIVEIVSEFPEAEIAAVLAEMKTERADESSGMDLVEVGGGWQLRTKGANSPWIFKLNKARPVRLSRAALETLAIVAYRQPVTRPEVDEIRGVDSGPVLRNLLERNLLKILGKREEPGSPLIYGTTKEFLEFFGLNTLSDLPSLREYTELGDESCAKLEELLAREGVVPEMEPAGSLDAEEDDVPSSST